VYPIKPFGGKEYAMTRKSVSRIAIALLLVLTVAAPVFAQDRQYSPISKRCSGPTGEAILFDLALLRPAGLVAMGVGAVLGVFTYPMAQITRSEDRYDQKLFMEPYEYTFVRPMGEMDYSCDEVLTSP
jgi:hypothetical protein